jgi:two-component system, OmpR family, sensor histidine kinase TctE
MKIFRLQSLQARLALRLTLLYVAATTIAVAILVYQAYEAADSLNDRELSLRAADLVRFVTVDSSGAARLELPPELAARYQAAGNADIFAIRSAQDTLLAASPPNFGSTATKWPTGTREPSYFHLKDFGSEGHEYYGLTLVLGSSAGPVSVSVARAADADALVHSMLREFLVDVSWIIPLLISATLVVGVVAIQSAFRPLAEVSRQAAAIGPGTTSIRLPEKNLPSEITPLVAAVNRALDRLEHGFDIQRRFTANAAHELRTPLAIVTAALDVVEDKDDIAKIRADVARMNRLVDQLLRVARLDAVALDVSDTVDLNDVASEIVAAMAPWSLARKRFIALHANAEPVIVRGNRYAIGDAIRNLIENAVCHAPLLTEVEVSTSADGTVSVADRGPGVPAEHHKQIFERFWRGSSKGGSGAGLGLAIVAEIVKAHQGSVSIDDNPGGGAIFTLHFDCLPVSETKETPQRPRGQVNESSPVDSFHEYPAGGG